MARISSIITFAAMALVAPAASQSLSRDATATVEILARSLTLEKTRDLTFGSHYASEGAIRSGQANHARWDGTTEAGAPISIAFSLPPELTRDGGGDAVPITFGSLSARADNGLSAPFNPSGGVYSFNAASDGHFFVFLGAAEGSDDDVVIVTLTGHQAGTYSGTITLTVTVL